MTAHGTGKLRPDSRSRDADALPRWGVIAYAAPVVGLSFFYIPMWSILPSVYGEYFGLELTTIAAVVLFMRLFDGVVDTTIGYLSDWHRARGGSRKPWAVAGGIGCIGACYFLFIPQREVTPLYYLIWSMVYFAAYAAAEIPHVTWGSELTTDYAARAGVYAMRNFSGAVGTMAFYALPLLLVHGSQDYTPAVLSDALAIGAGITLLGLLWMVWAAPPAYASATGASKAPDSARLVLRSLVENKPLLLYFGAWLCLGLSGGMWFGLIYMYLDSYLGVGARAAEIFLAGTLVAALSTPFWVKLIEWTSKTTAWAIAVALLAAQCVAALFLAPGSAWWLALVLGIIMNLFFAGHYVAALAMLGDITDYGKLKFRRDRGATYYGVNVLLFKVSLGVGGGLALGIAGFFGFDPSLHAQSAQAILGLKLGFCVVPTLFAGLGLMLIFRMPINRRRQRLIERRLLARERGLMGSE